MSFNGSSTCDCTLEANRVTIAMARARNLFIAAPYERATTFSPNSRAVFPPVVVATPQRCSALRREQDIRFVWGEWLMRPAVRPGSRQPPQLFESPAPHSG